MWASRSAFTFWARLTSSSDNISSVVFSACIVYGYLLLYVYMFTKFFTMKKFLLLIALVVFASSSYGQGVTIKASAESYALNDMTIAIEDEQGFARFNYSTGIYTYQNAQHWKVGAGVDIPIIWGTFVGVSAHGLIGNTQFNGPEIAYYLSGDAGIRIFDKIDVMSGVGIFKEEIYWKPLSLRFVFK